MALTEEQEWSRAVASTVPGAKGWVEVRGWGDPKPLWCITLPGIKFEGYVKKEVARQFDAHWRSVLRLTGEMP